jgi:hypothetical protein
MHMVSPSRIVRFIERSGAFAPILNWANGGGVLQSWVLAVVDAAESVPVVWWVDYGPEPNVSRLCGAWVLDTEALARQLPALTAGRTLLPTSAGRAALEGRGISAAPALDAESTLGAVTAARDELQAAYEKRSGQAGGRALVPPKWPELPGSLTLDDSPVVAADGRASRALSIARWLVQLCTAWEEIEQQRLSRSYLRDLGGNLARPLPVVLTEATVSA